MCLPCCSAENIISVFGVGAITSAVSLSAVVGLVAVDSLALKVV